MEAIEAFAQRHQLPARHDAMTKVRKQVPALAALVDFWWQGVHQDWSPSSCRPDGGSGCTSASSRWSIGTTKWLARAAADGKPRCRQALEAVRAAFDQHAITQRLAPHVLAEWHAWATAAGRRPFSATSSAVEGRNGYSVANASQSARLAQAALQGVDGPA